MIKFCYNPSTRQIIDCGYNDHAVTLYNAGKQKEFDQFIRGIIIEGTIYFRVFYPFPIDEGMNIDNLKKASLSMLKAEFPAIKKALHKIINGVPCSVVFNADNETFKRLGIAYI